jgi:hypothetical protein
VRGANANVEMSVFMDTYSLPLAGDAGRRAEAKSEDLGTKG